MKIRIKDDEHDVRLWLPTSLLKSRIGYSIVKQALKNNHERSRAKALHEQDGSDDNVVAAENAEFNMPLSREQVKEMYAIIKRAIKANGHFNLVEVESADGEKVIIRV